MGLGALALYSSYSYSDTVYGQSVNAAGNGLTWGMQNILPPQAGLTVTGVIYQYTTVKDAEDFMLVHVQNENAQGPGYIFRETDDWTGQPGNTINKLVPVGSIPLGFWGNGSIEVEGSGIVTDPTVVYNYQYDPCYDPQSDPSCPGFQAQNLIDVIDPLQYVKDPLDDEIVQEKLEQTVESEDEQEEDEEREQVLESAKERLEKFLGGQIKVLVSGPAEKLHSDLMNLNYVPVYYFDSIEGGSYEDVLIYEDKQLPGNYKARRIGFAQDLLHEKMVQSQYDN